MKSALVFLGGYFRLDDLGRLDFLRLFRRMLARVFFALTESKPP